MAAPLKRSGHFFLAFVGAFFSSWRRARSPSPRRGREPFLWHRVREQHQTSPMRREKGFCHLCSLTHPVCGGAGLSIALMRKCLYTEATRPNPQQEAPLVARIVFFGLAIFFFFWGTSQGSPLEFPGAQPYVVHSAHAYGCAECTWRSCAYQFLRRTLCLTWI